MTRHAMHGQMPHSVVVRPGGYPRAWLLARVNRARTVHGAADTGRFADERGVRVPGA